MQFCDDYNGFAISENVPYFCLPRCGGKMSNSNSTENKLYVYSLSAFWRFSATVLVTLSMLTDRAGCYNAREKKLILPVRPCVYRFYSFWVCSRIEQIVTTCVRKSSLYASLPLPSIPMELPPSPCAEKVYAFFDFLKCMNAIFRNFK